MKSVTERHIAYEGIKKRALRHGDIPVLQTDKAEIFTQQLSSITGFLDAAADTIAKEGTNFEKRLQEHKVSLIPKHTKMALTFSFREDSC